MHEEQTQCDDAPDPEEVLSPLLTQAGHLTMASFVQEEELCVTMETVACHPCKVCDEVFSNVKCLKNHIETIHACGITQGHSENSSLTKSGRPIHLSPNFGSKHVEFLRSMNLDHNDILLLNQAGNNGFSEAKHAAAAHRQTGRQGTILPL